MRIHMKKKMTTPRTARAYDRKGTVWVTLAELPPSHAAKEEEKKKSDPPVDE